VGLLLFVRLHVVVGGGVSPRRRTPLIANVDGIQVPCRKTHLTDYYSSEGQCLCVPGLLLAARVWRAALRPSGGS
jgi:hypothetical protein